MKRTLILITLLIAQSIPTVAESREKDLDRWVDRNLIPYVRQQLVIHPRFKNETVMFVVLDDNAYAIAFSRLPWIHPASRSAGSRGAAALPWNRARRTACTTTCTTTSASS